MKIAAVTMVKNECDIIELFIKINLRFFDAIYILDHGSTDATAKIIKLMKESSHNVYYTLLNDSIYNQSKITTAAVRQIAKLNLYDFIMPIDADEFIPENNITPIKAFLQDNIIKLDIGYFPWKTYCPLNRKYFETAAPLYNNFAARRTEENQFYKVLISNQFGKTCTIAMGNHDAANGTTGKLPQKHIIPSFLIHAPIRSEEQIMCKTILGSYAFKLKKDRKPGEGFHWDELAQEIRGNKYSISDRTLFSIAANYALPKSKWRQHESMGATIDAKGEKIGRISDSIEFEDLARINILENFDMKINEVLRQIK
jgi:glycosyltransferase involved in cell wall biosynthesis